MRCAPAESARSSSSLTTSSRRGSTSSASRACCNRSSSAPVMRCGSRSNGSKPHGGGRIVVACGDMPLVPPELFAAMAGSLGRRAATPDGAGHRRRCRCRQTSAASCAAANAVERIVEVSDATPDGARDRRDERGHLRIRRRRAARCRDAAARRQRPRRVLSHRYGRVISSAQASRCAPCRRAITSTCSASTIASSWREHARR